MRVAYITSQAVGHAGWGRYTVELVKGAIQAGIVPVLVTPQGKKIDPILADLEHHVILPDVLTRRFETPRSLAYAPALRKIVKTVDLVHSPVELYAPLIAAASMGLNVPYLISAQGTWAVRPLENRSQRPFFVPAFQRAAAILALSHYTAKRMKALFAPPRMDIVTGGVHPEIFGKRVDVDLPTWAAGKPIILSVGAVKPRKGQEVSIEALAMVRQSIADAQLVIIGNADERPDFTDTLKQRAAELGVSDAIHWLGRVASEDELIAWYQRADVYLTPSLNEGSSFEGLGLVFLEAAAAGTPSVGTLDCGAEDAIIDGQTGFLVPQRDPQKTAEALVKILANDKLRNTMKSDCYAFAQQLSWGNFMQKVTAIYDDVLKSS